MSDRSQFSFAVSAFPFVDFNGLPAVSERVSERVRVGCANDIRRPTQLLPAKEEQREGGEEKEGKEGTHAAIGRQKLREQLRARRQSTNLSSYYTLVKL